MKHSIPSKALRGRASTWAALVGYPVKTGTVGEDVPWVPGTLLGVRLDGDQIKLLVRQDSNSNNELWVRDRDVMVLSLGLEC